MKQYSRSYPSVVFSLSLSLSLYLIVTMEWEIEEVTNESIETLLDTANQPWFMEEDVGTCIGLVSIVDQTRRISSRDRKTRAELVSTSLPRRWPEVDRDVFLSVNGLTAVTTHSRKPKARHVTAWLIRRVLPRVHETVVKKQRNKITRHEMSLISNGVKLGYLQRQVTSTQCTNTKRRPRPVRMLSGQLEEGSSRKKRQRIVNFLTLKYIFPTNKSC